MPDDEDDEMIQKDCETKDETFITLESMMITFDRKSIFNADSNLFENHNAIITLSGREMLLLLSAAISSTNDTPGYSWVSHRNPWKPNRYYSSP